MLRVESSHTLADGLLGVGFTSLIPSVAAQLYMKTGGTTGLATVCGLCVFSLGPGQFLSPTVAGYILTAAHGRYIGPILYSGAVMVTGSLLLLPGRFTLKKQILAVF
jgi:hypothetical protein